MTTTHSTRARRSTLDALERPMLEASAERSLLVAAQAGDRRASAELVGAHLRLVRAIARRTAHIVSDDILAEGILGLVEAIDRFDVQRGVRLATYASHWIRARIQQFVLANRCIVGSPDTRACRRVYGQMGRARRALATRASDPGAEELAREIGVSASDVERVLAAQGRDVSIDTTHEAAMPPDGTTSSSPEDRFADAEIADARRRVIGGVLALLPARERGVVEARALADDSETLEQLAGKLTLSRERVRQLEARALRRIGDALSRRARSVMQPESKPSTLVVGFDGSADDERVAEVAVDLASELGASVELVSAVDLASGDPPDDGPSHVAHAAMAARVAARSLAMEQVGAIACERMTLRTNGRVRVHHHLAEGRPHEILQSAGERPNTWLVLGARRARTVLARTVDQVLRRATCPVLVVPDGVTWHAKGVVVTGIDAGELDARVLRIAEGVASTLARRLGVVHVRTSGDDSTTLRVTSHVRDVAPSVATSATLSVMHVSGSIAATLAEHAQRVEAALLLVGTHSRRGLERWVIGSTAESLAHVCSTPYLVVR